MIKLTNFYKTATKRCYKCKKDLLLENFYKKKASIDGFQNACKECLNKQMNAYVKTEAGKAAHNKATKKWRETDEGREYYRKKAIKTRANLADSYVRRLAAPAFNISYSEVTEEEIEAYRNLLKLKRLYLKKEKQNIN